MTSEVRRLAPDDWRVYRAIRLEALASDPTAFGSSWAREAEFTEATWRERLRSVVFAAELADETVGIIGGVRPQDRSTAMLIVGMWVRPETRGQGVAGALLGALRDHARQDGAEQLRLWVTETNSSARRLYERWGFEATGGREPLLSHPTIPVIEMVRDLATPYP